MLFSPEKLIGTVAICNKGRIALIRSVRRHKGGKGYIWEGTGLYENDINENDINWSSSNPLPIAWSLDDYNQAREMWTKNIERIQ